MKTSSWYNNKSSRDEGNVTHFHNEGDKKVHEDFFMAILESPEEVFKVDLKDKPFFFFLLLLFLSVPFVSSILLLYQQQFVEHLLVAVVVELELVLELLVAEEQKLLELELLLLLPVAAAELVADSLVELSAELFDTLPPYVATLKYRFITR